jgi:hypothetical protein
VVGATAGRLGGSEGTRNAGGPFQKMSTQTQTSRAAYVACCGDNGHFLQSLVRAPAWV